MHKKNHLILALIFFVAGVIWANSAFAAWTSTIKAEGDNSYGPFLSDVEIGVDTVENIISSPPAPAGMYSVKMDLVIPPSSTNIFRYYQADGEETYMWVVQIDPNGIVESGFPASPIPLASTMSWDTAEFGTGAYEMRSGFDGLGSIVVADMTTTTSYDVPAGTDNTYYTIHFTPASQECVADEDCADGAFCNGAETCNAGTCQAGTSPVTDDGVGCTDDSCDETNDVVINTPNDSLCDNGAFCDGSETCDATQDCQAGTPPATDDGVGCTDDSCDEGTDTIINTPNDGNCADDGAFCNGDEFCDAATDCSSSGDSCGAGLVCNETTDVCDACAVDADCDDGAFCNGAEICNAGTCESGTPPDPDDGVACTDDSCNETTDVVVNALNNANCDNGLYCDGDEFCDATLDCQGGYDPCGIGDTCNDTSDICEYCGDGIKNGTDECDDGNDVNDDSCTDACTSPVCGDSIVNGTDECDDGNDVNDDSCTDACTSPVCGDSIVNGTDECDDGDESATCNDDCTSSVCGDGKVNTTDGEECDDGNDVNTDTCWNSCIKDTDLDGVRDSEDNAPYNFNPPSDCDENAGTPDEQCDTDGDGVGDAGEMGPDGTNDQFDGDGDGTRDLEQDTVASVFANYGLDYVTFSTDADCALVDLVNLPVDQVADLPADVDFPFGLFDFAIIDCLPGTAVTVTLTMPPGTNLPSNITVNSYHKFGPIPSNTTPHWYDFMYDDVTQTGVSYLDDVVTFDFIDGERGDDDLNATNGIIIDQGGPSYVVGEDDPPTTSTRGGDGGGSSSSWCFIDTLFSSFKKKN